MPLWEIGQKKVTFETSQHEVSLEFARSHVTKHEIHWKNILWSEETKLELFGLKVKCCVWRNTKNTKQDGDNAIFCGCLSIEGTETLRQQFGKVIQK